MIYSIQYLRGVAAFVVLMGHVAWKSEQYAGDHFAWFNIGRSGVDLFFIISGFIMCYTTANKSRRVSIVQFLKNRMIRIIPLYWILTSVALMVFIFAPNYINTGGGVTRVLESYLFIPTADKLLIQAGWTLSYEFYFYVIFAFGLFYEGFRGHVLSMMILLGLIVAGQMLENVSHMVHFLTNNLLAEFIMGMLLYHIYQRVEFKSPVIPLLIIGVGVALFVVVNNHEPYYLLRSIYWGVPSFFICMGFLFLEKRLAKAPNSFLYMLGNSSYSLYLVHPFALSGGLLIVKLAGIEMDNIVMQWGFIIFMFLLAISTGYLCYRFLELPVTSKIKSMLSSA